MQSQQIDKFGATINNGNIALQNGNYQQAWLFAREAYTNGCTLAELHVLFGAIYEQINEIDKALAAYDYATKLDPSLAQAFNNSGRMRMANGRFTHALANFQKAISLQPDNARAHYNLGAVYHYQHDFEKALESFRYSAKLNYPAAQSKITEIQAQLGEKSFHKPSLPARDKRWYLEQAIVALSTFAYDKMGPDRHLEEIEKTGLWRLSRKPRIRTYYLWMAYIEQMILSSLDETLSSPLIAHLNIFGTDTLDTLMIRVGLRHDQNYEVSFRTYPLVEEITQEEIFVQHDQYIISTEYHHLSASLEEYFENGILKIAEGYIYYSG